MTEEEQWTEINWPTFYDALCTKIKDARIALTAAEVEAVGTDWLKTNVNSVDILWREEGDDILTEIGERQNGEPFYRMRFPTTWLEA